MTKQRSRVMPELVFRTVAKMDVVVGFKGNIVKRAVPGVHVPVAVQELYPSVATGNPAVMRVSLLDDPDVYYEANVTRLNEYQSIVCTPVCGGVPDERFPPGTAVFVERATRYVDETMCMEIMEMDEL
ncbi:MAG: hypothetical protein U9Q37_03075 [Euryarchaeota archaeon]|nr:hypothetical protein [Euryarchaeota archaeon]